MKRTVLYVLLLAATALPSAAQDPWNVVWRMTAPPYLTLENITEMGIVKAGFDTDKDGWGEFLCAWTDLDTNAIMMYEATGNDTYALVWSWVYPVSANSFAGIAVGDVNNNGVVDIVTTMPSTTDADPKPPRIWVFEWNGVTGKNDYGIKNAGTGRFDPSASWNFDLPDGYDFRPYSLTIEDIDKDTVNELIVGVRTAGSGSSREVYVVSVTGSFDLFPVWETEWSYTHDFGGSLYSVTTGDLDNDGKREIYAFVWNSFTMRIFECGGNRQFTEVFAVDEMTAAQGVDYGALDAVRMADVNKDGMNELYIAGTEPTNTVFIVTGVTDVSQMTAANIKPLYTVPKTAGGKFRSMYIADPDHDGRTDLMIAGETNGQIFSLEYKGSGNPADSANWEHRVLYDIWTESGVATLTPRLFYGSPAGDMDKDGKDEYVFVNYAPDFGIWPQDSPLRMIEIDKANAVRDGRAPAPSGFALHPNHPNPFNPSTTLRYSLPDRAAVNLTVFDALGRRMSTVVREVQEEGEYSVRVDAAGWPSGVYFAMLTADGMRSVRRMVLLK